MFRNCLLKKPDAFIIIWSDTFSCKQCADSMRAMLIDHPHFIRFSHQAGFEVSSTTRYTGTMEACILATRDWTAGETVQCCSGAIVDLTKEDDAKLKSEGRDFSVMVSTRKKCTCLFLGPARFMNVSSVCCISCCRCWNWCLPWISMTVMPIAK